VNFEDFKKDIEPNAASYAALVSRVNQLARMFNNVSSLEEFASVAVEGCGSPQSAMEHMLAVDQWFSTVCRSVILTIALEAKQRDEGATS
jgi:hypothetical protein